MQGEPVPVRRLMLAVRSVVPGTCSPEAIANPTNLTQLALARNNLTGTIPGASWNGALSRRTLPGEKR